MKAFSAGLNWSIRARHAVVSSTGDTFFARMRSAASRIPILPRSSLWLPLTGLIRDFWSVLPISGTFTKETAAPAMAALRNDLRETSSEGFVICGGVYHLTAFNLSIGVTSRLHSSRLCRAKDSSGVNECKRLVTTIEGAGRLVEGSAERKPALLIVSRPCFQLHLPSVRREACSIWRVAVERKSFSSARNSSGVGLVCAIAFIMPQEIAKDERAIIIKSVSQSENPARSARCLRGTMRKAIYC